MTDFFEKSAHQDAVEFLHEISDLQGVGPSISLDVEYIFRGQSDSSFDLTASCYRTANFDFFNAAGSLDVPHKKKQFRRLAEFYRNANAQGLALPSLSPQTHRALMDPTLSEAAKPIMEWPGSELYELLAIAQHYGHPTPLLDWSHSPVIAATFAAKDAMRTMISFLKSEGVVNRETIEAMGSRNIAVWTLSKSAISQVMNRHGVSGAPYIIDYVIPPTRDNANIVAQRGCFTLVKDAKSDQESLEKTSMDLSVALLENINARYERQGQSDFRLPGSIPARMALTCVTLPYREVPRLLKTIFGGERPPVSVFPGYAGCAEVVRMSADLELVSRFNWGS